MKWLKLILILFLFSCMPDDYQSDVNSDISYSDTTVSDTTGFYKLLEEAEAQRKIDSAEWSKNKDK